MDIDAVQLTFRFRVTIEWQYDADLELCDPGAWRPAPRRAIFYCASDQVRYEGAVGLVPELGTAVLYRRSFDGPGCIFARI